jgi:hypothetical protein
MPTTVLAFPGPPHTTTALERQAVRADPGLKKNNAFGS